MLGHSSGIRCGSAMGKRWPAKSAFPSEHPSGGRQRLGAMSKQGNTLLHYLWREAPMHAVERDPE